MATYKEIFDIQSDDELRNRITVGCLVAAQAIIAEDSGTANHANRVLWAKDVLNDPTVMAKKMFRVILAENKAATVAQIKAASDATIQTAVNNAVNVLAS